MVVHKLAQVIKRRSQCTLYRVDGDCMWISNGAALYRAGELPDLYGREQTMAVLSFTPKQSEKIHFSEFDFMSGVLVDGLNIKDYDQKEEPTEPVSVAVIVDGKYANARITSGGELIFYDPSLLSPIMDDLEDMDYMKITMRTTPSGKRYLAVKNGLNILAILMPMQIVNDEYLAALGEFQALCTDQFFREKTRRELTEAEQLLEEAEQQTMEEAMNESSV